MEGHFAALWSVLLYLNGSLDAEAVGCGQIAWYVAEVVGCGQIAGYVAEAEGCGCRKGILLKLTEYLLYILMQHALAPLRRSGTKLEKTSLSTGAFRRVCLRIYSKHSCWFKISNK